MKRILVIEDNTDQRELFKTALEEEGYEVIEAPDGKVDFELYRQQLCDLVIIDIFMPEKGGFEAILKLKRKFPNVKIIAISGGVIEGLYGKTFEADEALIIAGVAGADCTLSKPIKIQHLLAMVDELLKVKDLPDHSEYTRSPLSKGASKKRILVIEDDTSQRQLFKTALEQAGYEVLDAPDGQAGLQLYHQQPCDLIITDIFMPKEDGIETIFDLKTQCLTVKIIAISGGGSWAQYGKNFGADDPLEMAKHFGADRTLKKPIKIQRLLAMVDDLLNVKGRLYSNDSENPGFRS